MSELRHQLHAMRAAYRGERYPGDLAAEILVPPPRRLPIGRFAAAASAIVGLAAAVALWLSLDRTVVPVAAPPTGERAVAVAPATTEFATIPALPGGLPALPEAESMLDLGPMSEIGGMPAMPSMDLNFSFDDPDVSEDSV